ncbi:hypothetical protein COY16_05655 [Candidatus Roizmanbacteria bacterium CG_4_10_14_0_2_um_filter_39_13]|uniref:DUF1761 domain-containing protein n=1 Tax=Candidatus Roizmanbacteria bacterium CG_4_10_14_0_2_um_filter_39_13 TaxID=1974825 RepID=A0A2M7TVU2_9BACT|nr:MAG: hypothetical protein COY16_05655 [Candidatus Roizmanbacteria bacterium CG_4_10_14_0_2_um_filter_39_13]
MSIGGILLSVVSYMIIGSFWYSGAFLGKVWQKLVGLNMDTMDKDKMIKAVISSAIAAFIMATVLNYFIVEFEVETLIQALIFGAMVWVGFSATTILITNSYQQKPILLTLVDGGYQLVSLLAMSAIQFYLI